MDPEKKNPQDNIDQDAFSFLQHKRHGVLKKYKIEDQNVTGPPKVIKKPFREKSIGFRHQVAK